MKIDNINLGLKVASKIISVQEGGSGLSHMRFVQDTGTGLLPKAIFARSKADLLENSFLELSESALVYYGPAILGQGIFRKMYSKNLSNTLKSQISVPAVELMKKNLPENRKLLSVKAAIALSCMLIPLVEFSLNYFKNLLTLKIFKQGDFTDIANLDKNKSINTKKNLKVEQNAKKNIFAASILAVGCVALSGLLARYGKTSKILQHFSEFILAPGTKLFKNTKKQDFVNKYFSIDFANNNGKLALSKGQLTSCVLVGGLGYFGSAKDRGKQNFLEVLYRMPLVGFYIICGNELLEKAFKKMLLNFGKCTEIIDKNLDVPKIKDLIEIAKKIQTKKGGNFEEIYKKLLKQKIFISAVPFLFGIGVMGFFVAASSRFFTQYRYDKEKELKNIDKQNLVLPQVFSPFLHFRGKY